MIDSAVSTGRIAENNPFVLNGREGTFGKISEDGGVKLLFDGEVPRPYIMSTVTQLYSEGKLLLGSLNDDGNSINRTELTDKDRVHMKQREPFVMPLFHEKAPTSRDARKRVRQAAREKYPDFSPISSNMQLKLFKQVKKLGGLRIGLLEHIKVKKKKFKIDPRLKEIIDFLYENKYLKELKEDYSQSDFINAIEEEIDDRNRHYDAESSIPKPSQPTVSRFLTEKRKEDPITVDRCRLGEQAYKLAMRGRGQEPDVNRILEVLEFDGTLLDIIIGDVDNGIILGRPYLIITRDRKSKSINGFSIGFEGESTDLIAKALRNSILPKDELVENYPNVKNKWRPHGIPFEGVLDLGSGFISDSFEDICDTIGIQRKNTPAATPWFKGAVESCFRTFGLELLRLFPAHTKTSKDLKQLINQGKLPVVSLSDFYALLLEWIVDIYQHEPHGVNGIVPDTAWEKDEKIFPPRLPKSVALMDVALGLKHEPTLQEYGIQFKHIRYKSDDMAALWAMVGKGFKLKMKYSPDDLNVIYYYNPITEKWNSATSKNQRYTKGLTLREHEMHRERIVAAKKIAINMDSLIASKKNHRKRCEALAKKFESSSRNKISKKERSEYKLHLVHSSDIPVRVQQTAALSGALIEMHGLSDVSNLPKISQTVTGKDYSFNMDAFKQAPSSDLSTNNN